MKYLEIEHFIVNEIECGRYKYDDIIMSENQLAKKFNASRMTARKAISNLVSRNYLYQVMRKGTFVINHDAKLKIFLNKTVDFSENIIAAGGVPKTVSLDYRIKTANRSVTEKLQLMDNEKVYYIERLRCIGNTPVILEGTHIPCRFLNNITAKEVEILKYKYVKYLNFIDYTHGKTIKEFSATVPCKKIQKALRLDNQMPIFRIDILSSFKTGEVYEYSNIYYNQSKYRFLQVVENN